MIKSIIVSFINCLIQFYNFSIKELLLLLVVIFIIQNINQTKPFTTISQQQQ